MKIAKRLLPVIGLLALLLLATLSATRVSAQGPAPNVDDEVMRISKDLYCPVCSGVPLAVCDTQACVQWRALIREKLLAGQNEAQIREYFIAQYGERVLGAPPPEGFNLSAYILPVLALAIGVVVLFWTTRAWLKRQPTAPTGGEASNFIATSPQIPPEYAERIARELKARE